MVHTNDFQSLNDSYHIKEDNKDSKVVCIKILNQDTTQVKPAFQQKLPFLFNVTYIQACPFLIELFQQKVFSKTK